MNPVPEPLPVFPEAVASLIRDGKPDAAEQRLLRTFPTRPERERAVWALEMAHVWASVDDANRARRWLARMPLVLAGADALRAARLGGKLGDPLLAHEWYERTYPMEELADAERLAHAKFTLAAAERMRLPHGRQGSWQRHLALLKRAEELLLELVKTADDPAISAAAADVAERAGRLLGSKSKTRQA